MENALTAAGPDGLVHPATTGPYEHMNLDNFRELVRALRP